MLLAMALANRSRSGVASAAVLALVLAEALPGRLPLAQVPTADAVDAAIRASILPGSVLELPTGIRDGFGESGGLDHRALVHQLVHQRPLVGGFVARLSPDLRAAHQADPALRRVIALSTPGGKDGSPAGRSSTSAGTEADLALLAGDLASLGVRFLIINRDTEVGSRIPLDVIVRSGFQPVIEDGSRVLYVLPAGHQ